MNLKIAIAKGLVETASPLIGLCKQQAALLEGQFTTKAFQVNGCTAILKVQWDSATAIISCPQTGILLHPRQGPIELFTYEDVADPAFFKQLPGVKGGWRDGTTLLDTEYLYPLVDSDNATFLVSKDVETGTLGGEFLGSDGNYGTLYWWNGETEEASRLISWKGTPTRHFGFPTSALMPGLTQVETTTQFGTSIHTTFDHYIYSGGEVIAAAPRFNWPYSGPSRCFITGAAYDANDTLWIVTQSDRAVAPSSVLFTVDGEEVEHTINSPGIYTVLWKEGTQYDGWDYIAEWNTSKLTTPWFANKQGTSFVNSSGAKIDISIDENGNYTATLVEQPIAYGSYIEASTPEGSSVCSDYNVSANFSDNYYFEYKDATLVSCPINYSFRTTSTLRGSNPDDIVYTGKFPSVTEEDLPPPVSAILHSVTGTVPDILYVNDTLKYIGGQGPVTWSATGLNIDQQGRVTAITACSSGGQYALATVTATDNCGNSVSITVRVSGGVWLLSYTNYSDCTGQQCVTGLSDCDAVKYGVLGCDLPTTSKTCEEIQGNIKVVTVYGAWDGPTSGTGGTCGDWYKNQASGPLAACSCTGGTPFAINTSVYNWVCP